MTNMKEKLKKNWMENWPEVIARSEVHKYSGGMVAASTLANNDCQGTGPLGKTKINGNIYD